MHRCLIALLLAVVALAGCGRESGSDRPEQDADLLLDFTPNAVHAGIYTAVERGYDDAEGVRLRIRPPSSSTDAVKLLAAGRVDMAILDIHDLGLARERGADLVGVLAIVQRPLAALFTRAKIRRPRQLEGKRAGVTGLPSDEAVLRSIVTGDGGDPKRVRETTIGFESVPALIGGRVDGATAFWNVEGVALAERQAGIREFRVDEFGAPPYPELVLAVKRETAEREAPLIRATARALQRGYGAAQNDPESTVQDMRNRVRGLDTSLVAEQLDTVSPVFTAGAPVYGALSRPALERWARWDKRFGILERVPDVDRAFRFDLVPGKDD